MILIRNGFDCEIVKSKVDNEGRYILLKLLINDNQFVYGNIYAPNKVVDRETFFKEINTMLESLNVTENDNTILGGDWNTVLNPKLDKKVGKGAN